MAGLLSPFRSQDPLLGRFLMQALSQPAQQRPRADAADEAMYASAPNGSPDLQAEGARLLAAQQAPQGAPSPQPSAQPAMMGQPQGPGLLRPAQRRRVSGGRVALRTLFGGENPFDAIDSERQRLTAEAQRPARLEQDAQILATITDPRERALFLTDRAEWAKNVGQQYAPQVIAAGSGQAIGGRLAVEMPSYVESGDQTLRRSSAGVEPVYTRTAPSITEQTAQDKLAWDQEYGRSQLGISQQNADTSRIGAERPQVVSLSPGEQAYGVTSDGSTSALAQSTIARLPSPQDAEMRGALDTNQREVIPTLNAMRDALRSGDVITGFGADMRLQALRAAAAIGNQEAARQVAATENYRNMSGRLRVGMAKTLGANPSNADIALLEKVTAGDIGQNDAALMATIDQGLSFANRRNTDLQAQMAQSAPRAADPSASASAPAQPRSAAEYQALPPGTLFVAPDGSTRRKP